MKLVWIGLVALVAPWVCAALVDGPWLAEASAASRRYLRSHPNDRQHLRWGDDEAQGVAHDEAFWYFTERAHLTRIPVHADVDSNGSPDREVGLPRGCRHFGDPAHSRRDATLYVPLEDCPAPGSPGSPGRPGRPGRRVRRVVGYDAALTPRRSAVLVGASHAAWLAVDPRDGTLVSSSRYSASQLEVYAADFADGAELSPLRTIVLLDHAGASITVPKIQGGEFSESGRLYLTSDAAERRLAGVWIFDVDGGRATLRERIGAGGVAPCQEVEGITIWDTRDVAAPSIGGEIHWLLHSNRGICGDSNLWFKHLSVADPRAL